MRPSAKPSGFLFGGEAPWCYSTMTRRFRKGQKLLQISGYASSNRCCSCNSFFSVSVM